MGSNNVNAQVNLEIDFTREVSQEIVDPDGSATLSEQNSLNVTAKKDAIGIPGAISNEPPQGQPLIKNKIRRVLLRITRRRKSKKNLRQNPLRN